MVSIVNATAPTQQYFQAAQAAPKAAAQQPPALASSFSSVPATPTESATSKNSDGTFGAKHTRLSPSAATAKPEAETNAAASAVDVKV